MSCHLSRRLTTIHRAVSMALLCSVSYVSFISSVQAATIGQTVVTSAQHEPLVASISISNIRAADFSASLANPIIYQQMGLTPTDSISVRFQPTSATSGQVLITTSQPVSKPFADVVLAINDNGQRNMVPKTLLMPLSNSLPINTAKNIVTGAKKPNLPSVSPSMAKPLMLRKGAPPPLGAMSALSSSTRTQPKTSLVTAPTTDLDMSRLPVPNLPVSRIQAPLLTATTQSSGRTYTPSRPNQTPLDASAAVDNLGTTDDKRISALSLNNQPLNGKNSDKSTVTNSSSNEVNTSKKAITADPLLTNKSLDTLSIQVTRQIQPSSKINDATFVAENTPPTPNNNVENIPTDSVDTSTTSNTVALNNRVTPSDSTVTANTTHQYQVQNNDSLWMIAQQIAQENNLNVQTVMKQIQSQNPDAFINKDADQLKADAKLSLPSYDVIPSQQNLEAAINAQRQYRRRVNTPTAMTPVPKSSKPISETSTAAKRPEKPVTTKTRTLPKAQFSVLAPGRDGNADGTQAKAAANTGNGISTDILATLKASRQSTASQAQQLMKTSSALSDYTRKIQLQNQKLAELQARLKKLRNQ
ncbi:FimV family protein [Psychrobacter sp. SWN149]|uniref:type IV pilus assembly protein FimV n=1 Tax=Psychrobacter sp. SWN149 TaxID=2792057 RepID=UPI0018CE466B|nr:peptigoglycan-binding protein LysM [Psychrobacter sp. SWN149]MBH0005850.1 peptigoglycan-binding protein LysM [Psychrobacter sp. SWN149]